MKLFGKNFVQIYNSPLKHPEHFSSITSSNIHNILPLTHEEFLSTLLNLSLNLSNISIYFHPPTLISNH